MIRLILVPLQLSEIEEIRQKNLLVVGLRVSEERPEVHSLIICDGLGNITEVLSFLRIFGALCLQEEVFLPGKILDAKYS